VVSFPYSPMGALLVAKGLRPWPESRPPVEPKMLSATAGMLSDSASLRRSSEAMNPTAVVCGGRASPTS
jgi:hypothetical protein